MLLATASTLRRYQICKQSFCGRPKAKRRILTEILLKALRPKPVSLLASCMLLATSEATILAHMVRF